jgi:hypothetical protein
MLSTLSSVYIVPARTAARECVPAAGSDTITFVSSHQHRGFAPDERAVAGRRAVARGLVGQRILRVAYVHIDYRGWDLGYHDQSSRRLITAAAEWSAPHLGCAEVPSPGLRRRAHDRSRRDLGYHVGQPQPSQWREHLPSKGAGERTGRGMGCHGAGAVALVPRIAYLGCRTALSRVV